MATKFQKLFVQHITVKNGAQLRCHRHHYNCLQQHFRTENEYFVTFLQIK